VLFDRFPDGEAILGGAPFNVAWHLQAFGCKPLLISRVGDDPLGREIRGQMQDWGMSTAGLQLDSAHPTGTVQVSYEGSEPHFDIVNDRAYDFIDGDSLPPIADPGLLYHGSLALRNPQTRRALVQLKEQHELPVFIDINLRPPWWDPGLIQKLLAGARWLKLNEHELSELTPGKGDRLYQIQTLQERYALDCLFLTLGDAGACAYNKDGRSVKVKPEWQKNAVDAVGAGDAFSSVIILGLLNDWPLETMMERAQSFASRLVQRQGATVADRAFYVPLLQKWALE
jgi:fructokinase